MGPGGLLPAYPVSNLIVPLLDCLTLGASGPSRPAAVYAKTFLLAHAAPGILVPNAEEYMKYIQWGFTVDSELQNCWYRPDLAAVEAKHVCCYGFQ